MANTPHGRIGRGSAPSYQGRSHRTRHIDFHGHIPREIWDSGFAAIVEIDQETMYVTGDSLDELDHAINLLGNICRDKPKLLKRFHAIDQVKAVPVLDLLVQGRNDAVGMVRANYDFEGRLAEYTRFVYSSGRAQP
jgi:hypothetical protein